VPNNEFGDFQTPRALAVQVLRTLGARQWARVLEPTCGAGTFLAAVRAAMPSAEVVGIEVQRKYADLTPDVIRADIFDLHLGADVEWRSDGPLLVVGNPPWVTNAQLSTLHSANRPERLNVKNLPGLEAMTGSSNFDIAEFIWVKLIAELRHLSPTIALLCKTQVARNVLEHCARLDLPVARAELRVIDARKWFNANVDACLFTLDVNQGGTDYSCRLFDSLSAPVARRRFGVVGRRLVADVDSYRRVVEGSCPIEWRQGLKHDAAAVMELAERDGPRTRDGQLVDIEPDYIYPLLKCTDVFRERLGLTKWVVVTQKSLGEDTERLARIAPKLWSYLLGNGEALDGRRSSIYRNRPRFGVFGIGDYSFAPFKVAVSGLHKSAEFRLIAPLAGKPVFLDDTCYLLPFQDAAEAALVLAMLRTPLARDFVRSLAFTDAKRPITKKLLQRIDLRVILREVPPDELIAAATAALRGIGWEVAHAKLWATVRELGNRWGPGVSP
jgi:hypothetical protein